MKINIVIFFCVLVVSLPVQSSEKTDIIGCWEATLEDVENNIATVCFNYEIGSISYYFTNEGDEPTRCYQHAFIKQEDETVLLEGIGGFCDNGRKQAELTFRCWKNETSHMPCEMYIEHTQMEMSKVRKK